MIGIIAALTVLGLSLFITRLATTALAHTGLSWEAAKFQARSAFTGTGFTTAEAETVVDHPVRRRIIMLLMVARSAGFLSIIISLILSFAGGEGEMTRVYRLIWLVAGVVVLWILAKSKFVERGLRHIIAWALHRWTDLDVRDYVGLLKLSGDYSVKELHIEEGDWLAGKPLSECRLNEEGVTILGIYRSDGSYVGAPTGDTKIYPDDTAILYGREKTLRSIDKRRADQSGEAEHDEAVSDQKEHEAREEQQEQEFQRQRESNDNAT
ncbi:MAG: potassium transporter TrkA [candidate division Zixibacteria bacterium]|nr:potassium transporter TrkA [candidate division Zixibacteria bacterium]